MKWLRTLILFNKGSVMESDGWKSVHDSLVRSNSSVDFPEGSGTLTLRKKFKRSDGQWERNGVVYLKRRFFRNLVDVEGWEQEVDVDLGQAPRATPVTLFPSKSAHDEPVTSQFGGFDFLTSTVSFRRACVTRLA